MSPQVETPPVRFRNAVCAAPAEALFLPVTGYPMPAEELRWMAAARDRIVSVACTRWHLRQELFIRFVQISDPAAAERFSANARKWRPELGLGAWPNRGAATPWKKDDFTDLKPDDRPRVAVDKVFRIAGDSAARVEACETMLGLGAVTEILISGEAPAFLSQTKQLLQPMQTHPLFRSFRMFMPNLDLLAIANASYEELQTWMCGAQLYVRESLEDTGLLIVSLQPLQTVLEAIGARSDPQRPDEWIVPVPPPNR